MDSGEAAQNEGEGRQAVKVEAKCAKCLRVFLRDAWKARKYCSRSCSGAVNAPTSVPAKERFWKFVEKGPLCWNWTASLTPNGYGRITERIDRVKTKQRYAHRLSYEINKGPIPTGLYVCHSCDNRRCVNPEHLWLGTQGDNIRDAANKGRAGRRPRIRSAYPSRSGSISALK